MVAAAARPEPSLACFFCRPRVRTKPCPLFAFPLASGLWLFVFPRADRSGMLTPMNPDSQQPLLLPSPASPPGTVLVNDRVSFQTEGQQRVILVFGMFFSHYSVDDPAVKARWRQLKVSEKTVLD